MTQLVCDTVKVCAGVSRLSFLHKSSLSLSMDYPIGSFALPIMMSISVEDVCARLGDKDRFGVLDLFPRLEEVAGELIGSEAVTVRLIQPATSPISTRRTTKGFLVAFNLSWRAPIFLPSPVSG